MALTQLPGLAGSITDSSTAIRSNVSMTGSDDWFSSAFVGDDPSGFGVIDTVGIAHKIISPPSSRVNTTLVAVETWPVPFAGNSTYSARVGILGLGPPTDGRIGSLTAPVGILSELKSRGDIASRSFGLHIVSVPFKQPGSLVLGGHERNRALGPVGVFRYDDPKRHRPSCSSMCSSAPTSAVLHLHRPFQERLSTLRPVSGVALGTTSSQTTSPSAWEASRGPL